MSDFKKENHQEEKRAPIRKKFAGVVISDKSDKTIIVLVETVKMNKKYQKRYLTTKKYKVHDEDNSFKVGDRVNFIECRPLSKDKKWRVLKK